MEKYVRGKRTLAVVAFLLMWHSCACFAAILPKPEKNNYCLDYTGVLDQKLITRINEISLDIFRKTGAQIKVLTIKSLDGQPLEEYTLETARAWGIGNGQKNNGVLIFLAVDDRKSRIEVGYGLEGALPDGKTGRIQDDYMLPAFKKGNYSEGIWQGYKAVALAVAAEYKIDIGQGQRAPPVSNDRQATDGVPGWMMILGGIGIVVLLLIDWIFFGGTFTWLILAVVFRRGGSGGGGSGGGSDGGSFGGGGSSRSW